MGISSLDSPTVVSLIQRISLERATATAIEYYGVTMSYGVMDALADRLARYLRTELDVRAGDFVGICLAPSPNMVVALLAVLKAGAAYVPIDADLPKQRIAYILQDAGLKVVLTQRAYSIDIELCALSGVAARLLLLDQNQAWHRPGKPTDVPLGEPLPQDLAYAVYTSGSTGEPKGVMIEHRGLVNLARVNVKWLGISERSRLIQFASLSFDAATWEIFSALAAGATLVLGTREDMTPGRALATFLAHKRVTMICMPPSLVSSLYDSRDDLPHLDTIVVAGEACPLSTARIWATPKRRLFNAYGPTEATVCATMYRFRGDEDSVPIGEPLPGVTVSLLDSGLNPVPADTPGELCIGGIGVARGYIGKPELNASAFIANPCGPGTLYRTGDLAFVNSRTGMLEFVGRKDNQIKIRGFRIELDAIERALCEHPGVQCAVAAAVDLVGASAERSKTLVGYIVAHPEASKETLSPNALHRFLAQRLPEYMVPPIFMQLAALPMMANRSKVDRAALPRPTTRSGSQPGDSKRAQQIAAIFDQALELPLGTFGVNSHFFEMGGNSMGVAHVVMALRTEFHVRMPPRQIYEHPDPTQLAALVDSILSSPYHTTAAENIDLQHEAMLDADIVPSPAVGAIAAPPRVILFTGATGFMGGYLVRELLERAPSLELICLVRGESKLHASERLYSAFSKYGLPTELLDRVRVYPGDIEHPTLGLPAEVYDRLAAEVDTVYHCAADINYIKPYSAMRGPNVLGTKNMLRFACASRMKMFHYISSIAVFGALRTLLGLDEVDEGFDISQTLSVMSIENGYTKSKWVAERLVSEAGHRGLPVSIYRPGFIEGTSSTGVANASDLMCRLLCGCIQLGIYPNFPDKYWLPIPVDYVAGATAALSLSGRSGVYHLVPQREQEAGHNEMFSIINKLGFPVQPVTPDVWFERIASCTSENALYPITSFLLEKVHAGRHTILEVHHRTPRCGSAVTLRALQESGITPPPIGKELIAKYLNYFVSIGLITAKLAQ